MTRSHKVGVAAATAVFSFMEPSLGPLRLVAVIGLFLPGYFQRTPEPGALGNPLDTSGSPRPHPPRHAAPIAPPLRLSVPFSSQVTRCRNHNSPGDSSELFSDADDCPDMRSAKNQSAAAKPRRDLGSDAAFSFRPCLGSGRASLAFGAMTQPYTSHCCTAVAPLGFSETRPY